ncbi:MAG: DNA polymerase I [Firmicutes bacterium]|nr:DNA polymerase I [Bacillota bacterium]
MKKLLIADGTNIMYRSFYGIRPFTTKSGLHTNAVYGSVTTLSRAVSDIAPDSVAVSFDLPTPTFRHKSYESYKATRKKAPEELVEQIEYVKKTVDAMGLHVVECEGYEADDILGTLSRKGENEGYEVYILTGDRDAYQLITDKTVVLYISNTGHMLFDRGALIEKYGAEPPVMVDIKALMGDSSDNIPGVPGIGEKTALKLISEYGSLDGIYGALEENSSAFSPSVAKKLASGKESAFLSFDLARIRCDAPVAETPDSLSYHGIDRDALKGIFAELEFYKLSERFGLSDAENTSAASEMPVIPEPAELLQSDIECIVEHPAVSFDGDSLYICSGEKIYKTPANGEISKKFFANHKIVCHDYKRLYGKLQSCGISAQCAFDTCLAAYVLRPGDSSYELSKIAMTYLSENITPKNGADEAYIVSKVAKSQLDELSRVDGEAEKAGGASASNVLYNIEIPLSPVLSEMERRGIAVDADGIRRYSDELLAAENQLAEYIYMMAGHPFNISSPKQLGTVLFDELKIPADKKTKSGHSTDADTLEGLRYKYDIVEYVLKYRQISKLRSTYGENLAAVADESGRIHTSFNQTVTATGRLSSTDPNLQNIPVRTDLGRELRRFFIAQSPEYILVDADYSQIELRILANISDDPVMSDAFLRGADIHASTAAEVFDVPEENVTKEMRTHAKAINFGIVYGIGAYSLSRDIHTSVKAAEEYIKNYLSTYVEVDKYLKATVAAAHEMGYVTTLFGRRRYIPEISASNKNTRSFGERVAMNSPIQGTAADVIKLAMINVENALRDELPTAKLILQVHDELIVECRREDADKAAEILKREMEGAVNLKGPLVVDVKCGASWYECK